MNAHQKGKGWCAACSSLLPLRTNRKPDKRQQNTRLTCRWLLRQQGLKGTQVGVKGELQNSEEKEVTDPFWEQSQGSGSGLKAQAGGRYQQREKQAERGTAETRIRDFTFQFPGEKGKQKTDPDTVSFPLEVLAEFRSHGVGIDRRLRNQSRKPQKS